MTTSDSYESGFDEDVLTPNNSCPECEGLVTTNTRETVCEDCGLVIEDNPIDHGPEWRSFEDDETNPSRTGAPLTKTRHDDGLTTEIGYRMDGNGNRLSNEARRKAGRLRREQGRTVRQTTADRNQIEGLYEIRRVVSRLDLGKPILEGACALFRSAQSEGLLPGRSVESFAAASVYAACRCNQQPVTVADIRTHARESGTAIDHAYDVLNRELGLPTPPRRPREFIGRYASSLPVTRGQARRVRHRAEMLAERLQDQCLSVGQNPRGVAAACIYHACRERHLEVTQAEIATTAEVAVPTIRNQWQSIKALGGETA
jgi:transcription initiation factor TFIIB